MTLLSVLQMKRPREVSCAAPWVFLSLDLRRRNPRPRRAWSWCLFSWSRDSSGAKHSGEAGRRKGEKSQVWPLLLAIFENLGGLTPFLPTGGDFVGGDEAVVPGDH